MKIKMTTANLKEIQQTYKTHGRLLAIKVCRRMLRNEDFKPAPDEYKRACNIIKMWCEDKRAKL